MVRFRYLYLLVTMSLSNTNTHYLCAAQINGQAVAMTMDEENKPWIDLAAALGKLVLNIVGENVLQKASINIVTRGKI